MILNPLQRHLTSVFFKNFPERSALNLLQLILPGHIHDRLQSGK